jgi:GNAT superfamily N-acetyltransferase
MVVGKFPRTGHSRSLNGFHFCPVTRPSSEKVRMGVECISMIREFRQEDAARCCEIINDNLANMIDYPAELRAYVRQKNTAENIASELSICERVVVFEKAENVIGMGALDGDVVKRVYVDPREHGIGAGSAIMDALEMHAKNLGLRAVGLGSSPGAVSFYVARGYTVKKRCTVEVNGMQMPSIQMEKNI